MKPTNPLRSFDIYILILIIKTNLASGVGSHSTRSDPYPLMASILIVGELLDVKMTELLGNEALIESLRTDVQDLHWAITDMVSRIGPVQQSSWKFPDKMSSELDMEDLLDLYSVSDDLEENQVAHIALYELVIDRFLYLIQVLSTFTKQMIAKSGNEIQDSNYTSIGLTVKQCCSRQIQLQTVVQQTMSDNNMKKMSEDIEQMTNATGSQLSLCSHGSHGNQSKPFTGWLSPSKMEEISRDACSKNTQTIETAFVPCEACGMVQRNLRQIGDTIINMCQSQKLPSSLQKFRPLVAETEWLSSIDVARWVSEQSKDISRMNKHLDYLMSTINPLKQELENSEKKCRKLEIRVANFDKDMAREREVQEALQKQFEIKIKNLEDSHRETVSLINQQKDEIFSNKLTLEDQLEQHKTDLQRQKKLLEELEKTRSQLERDLKENKTNSTEIQSLQSELSSLQSQLKDVSSKLEKANKDLSREQAKNKSSSKHSQSLQTKQGSLMQRIDDLDQENQDLRDQVATLEDEKDVIEESLQKAEEKTKQLTKKLKQSEDLIEQISTEKVELEKSICSLQDNIKVIEGKLEEAKERERLLIEYPDLNGPVNPDLTGTGDIVRDMENQVHANSIRIQVLEEQNEGLRHSVSKIMAAQGHKPKEAWKQFVLICMLIRKTLCSYGLKKTLKH
ncbi:hypothetical protein KUTeg_009790 [Tegillarca granosa]|uniref:Uncharacterized protein n=1 Tax=Tegillarca granosa TaxID=220873 RepID=A0ABQ9F958_TEGGR|nr:hypothetical protein KUTeg_009790 [Tegillarca granosa]